MFKAYLKKFRRDRKGQDVAEYSLLVALASLLALGVFVAASGNVQNLWNTASDTLNASSPAATSPGPATASMPASQSSTPPPATSAPSGR